MASTPAELAAWFRSGIARTVNGGDWEGGCVAAVYVGGQFGHSYAYAVQAANASGVLNRDASAAGDGSVHYWGGIWNAQFQRWDGHIGVQYQGLIYMASMFASIQFGNHLGAATWSQYQNARGLPYLGHAPRFGDQSLAGIFLAGGNMRPLPSIDYALLRRQKESGMYFKGANGTTYYVWTDANGAVRMRTCKQNEAAIAATGGLVIEPVNDATVTGMGVEAGWPSGGPEPAVPLPKVDLSGVTVPAPNLQGLTAAISGVPAATVKLLGTTLGTA